MPARKRSTRNAPDYDIPGDIGGGPGASDANSGGGNASGTPDAETGMRMSRPPGQSNVKKDKAKLFPQSAAAAKARSTKPLKTHGDKFEDKIPKKTRTRAKRK